MKSDKKNSGKLKSKNAPRDYKPGISPEKDAWFTALFIENHIDFITHPERAATPEQVRFMVYTEDDERYYPCSKPMFEAIMGRRKSDLIQNKYKQALQRVMELIDSQIEDQNQHKYLETLIKIKYAHEIRDQIMIPSRLEKRLLRIFLNRTQIVDPFHHEKT